uniref:Uncharacterized protein n=1 Tax=Pristionchus pacificus TaxID=54126 RepID=A0A2A6CH28_PRIPA|eukprot:PDM77390.1 hypothetical protein PRIPAC_33120 [Pristionchus pacificus]
MCEFVIKTSMISSDDSPTTGSKVLSSTSTALVVPRNRSNSDEDKGGRFEVDKKGFLLHRALLEVATLHEIAGFDKGNTHIFKFVCGRFVHETGGVLGESVVELEIRLMCIIIDQFLETDLHSVRRVQSHQVLELIRVSGIGSGIGEDEDGRLDGSITYREILKICLELRELLHRRGYTSSHCFPVISSGQKQKLVSVSFAYSRLPPLKHSVVGMVGTPVGGPTVGVWSSASYDSSLNEIQNKFRWRGEKIG